MNLSTISNNLSTCQLVNLSTNKTIRLIRCSTRELVYYKYNYHQILVN